MLRGTVGINTKAFGAHAPSAAVCRITANQGVLLSGSSSSALTLPSGKANLASHLRPSMLCSEFTALSASAAAVAGAHSRQQLLRHAGRAVQHGQS